MRRNEGCCVRRALWVNKVFCVFCVCIMFSACFVCVFVLPSSL